MKNIIQILFFSLLFLITAFSQDKNQRAVLPDKPTSERLRDIHKPNADDFLGLNERESLLLKSKRSEWQTALRNTHREIYEEKFNAKDSRTTTNKTTLRNGFLLVEKIQQTGNGSYWSNSEKYSYTYDSIYNLREGVIQLWNAYGSVWENSRKNSYTYDTNNNLTEELRQSWNMNGFTYENGDKLSYSYDSNNNRIRLLWQYYDINTWVNLWLNFYTYDGNNNLSEMLRKSWNGVSWENYYKSTYTYNVYNNLIEEYRLGWNGSSWSNPERALYTYDENNNKIEVIWQWLDPYSGWLNWERYSYSYSLNNNLIVELYQMGGRPEWVNYYRYYYSYDLNNNLIERLGQFYESGGFIFHTKDLYTYIPITAIEENNCSVNSFNLSNNYPNPFNPSTMISWQSAAGSWQTLKVYDVLGNEVATLVDEYKPAGKYEVEFNASQLSSGIYFYQLKTENFIETRKMILLK